MIPLKTNLDELLEFTNELRNSLPIPELPKQQRQERPKGTLYNIHKRSLPIGFDKIIVIGLLRDEADKETLRLIHKESKRRNEEMNDVFYYFDIVPMEANERESSIYFNETGVII